ncbi:tyrosinase family oxidase copper chaperone [Streptomyces anandii]|uniref:tyrosinase family oxidase copper chaperone n=1 Tax=Streptomyces anandii TaxID=285454 RepID=UPI00167AF46F|nr:tyrosinase family oxidase copper chaperone [Streptomyces anandii]GGX85998.1 hypothetical protein GCM10010510_33820 [Streptomyces anandii JCM 4720]
MTRSVTGVVGSPGLTAEPQGDTTRRRVLWGMIGSGAAVALAPLLAAPTSAGREKPEYTRFDETYRGRRISGDARGAGRSDGSPPAAWHVTVDGQPLHLMRRADGSWMTMIDHYQSYPTPLAAARAAVDELGTTARPGVPGAGGSRMEGSGLPSGRTGSEEDHSIGVHT